MTARFVWLSWLPWLLLVSGCLPPDCGGASGALAGLVCMLWLAACSTLPAQVRMGDLVAAALRACKTDGTRCQAAKLCAKSARDAAEAIQKSRESIAAGTEDAEASVSAALLPGAADAVCRGAGIVPAAVR